MSMSLKEFKTVLEQELNKFVDKTLDSNYFVNYRYVEGEVKKLYKTAMLVSNAFKELYAENHATEARGKPVDYQGFLAQVIADHGSAFSDKDNYVDEALTKLKDSLPITHSPEIKAVIQKMAHEVDSLIAKDDGKVPQYSGGLSSARAIVGKLRTSRLAAEIKTEIEYANNLALCATYSDCSNTRSSEGSYASGLGTGLAAAFLVIPPEPKKEKTAAANFDFTGHDVVFNCPGLKQSIAFVPIMQRIGEFVDRNSELDYMSTICLKAPFLGRSGRDIESILKGVLERKNLIVDQIDSSRKISEERKIEIKKDLSFVLRNTLLELKTTFSKGISFVAPKKVESAGISMSMG